MIASHNVVKVMVHQDGLAHGTCDIRGRWGGGADELANRGEEKEQHSKSIRDGFLGQTIGEGNVVNQTDC